MSLWIAYIYMEGDVNKEVCVNIEHVIVDYIYIYMEGDVNKEVCVNIEHVIVDCLYIYGGRCK